MTELTKEEWFWEQCRFKQKDGGWVYPDLSLTNKFPCTIPLLDLNNLKLYAFPLMDKVSIYIDNEYLGKKRNKVRVLYKGSFYDGLGEKLEDAIFESISKALGG